MLNTFMLQNAKNTVYNFRQLFGSSAALQPPVKFRVDYKAKATNSTYTRRSLISQPKQISMPEVDMSHVIFFRETSRSVDWSMRQRPCLEYESCRLNSAMRDKF